MVAVRLNIRRQIQEDGLDAWAEAISDPAPALNAIGEVMIEHIEQRFQTQTDPWGGAWAPHSAVTLAMQKRVGRILQQTRLMANSKYARITGSKRLVVGFGDFVKARVHQFGNPRNRLYNTPRGRRAPIPARPMLPLRPGRKLDLPADLRLEILETFKDALRLVARQHRGQNGIG